jgi:YjbR
MPEPQSAAPPRDTLARLRLLCLELPEVSEESAWEGIRWCVRGRNFAHVLMIEGGHPPAYARAAGTEGPACVVTFRLRQEACAAARFRRAPYFRPVWFRNIAGLIVDAGTDWDEVEALLKDSYRVLAPKKLAALVD